MKVLQINKYPQLGGGSETVLFETIRLLKENNFEVVLFATDEGSLIYTPTYTVKYPKKNDSFWKKIIELRSFFYNRKAAIVLDNLIKKEKPDVAHIHLYLNGLSSSILAVLKKRNIPVVMTLHDYRQICPSYLLIDGQKKVCNRCISGNYANCLIHRCSRGSLFNSFLLTLEMYYRRLFFKTENYVNRFICVSQFVFDKHQEFNKKIANKSTIIFNPIEANSNGIVIKQKKKYFLYFGRLSSEKGLDTLFKAISRFPNVILKVAGAGEYEFKNIPQNVEMLGFKSKEELSKLILEARYVIVPSESPETFGLSCAESLALGTPVLSSDIGALPEIIEHGKNGFLFRARDVESLVDTMLIAMNVEDADYKDLCLNAIKTKDRFLSSIYINKLLRVYDEVIGEVNKCTSLGY